MEKVTFSLMATLNLLPNTIWIKAKSLITITQRIPNRKPNIKLQMSPHHSYKKRKAQQVKSRSKIRMSNRNRGKILHIKSKVKVVIVMSQSWIDNKNHKIYCKYTLHHSKVMDST